MIDVSFRILGVVASLLDAIPASVMPVLTARLSVNKHIMASVVRFLPSTRPATEMRPVFSCSTLLVAGWTDSSDVFVRHNLLYHKGRGYGPPRS